MVFLTFSMLSQGCLKGSHTEHVPTQPAATKVPPSISLKQVASNAGRETYSIQNTLPPKDTASHAARPKPAPLVIEDDDPAIPVEVGITCKRKGCFTIFVSDEENRTGEGEGTICMYHPMPVSGVNSRVV